MQQKLLNFFTSVGYEDKNEDFKDASISKVVLNKQKESFEVFIENDRPINPVATFALNKCALKGINGSKKCHVNYIYNDMDDNDILEAFKVLLGELIIKRPSLVSLENIWLSFSLKDENKAIYFSNISIIFFDKTLSSCSKSWYICCLLP